MASTVQELDALIALDPDADEFRDMFIWSTGTDEQKANVAIKHLGRDLQGGRFDSNKNVVSLGDEVIFPTPELIRKHKDRINREIARQAQLQPSIGPGTRAGRSVKFSEIAKRQFVEQVEGGQIVDTPSGEVLTASGEPPKFVDKPPTLATGVQLLSLGMPMFAGPLGFIAAEIMEPGSTAEFGKDILDIAGEAFEVAPEAAVEFASRLLPETGRLKGLGRPTRRIPAQSAAAAVGTGLRRGVSAVLPGQDISLGETGAAAATAAALSAVSEGVAAGIEKPGRFAHRIAGRQLIGTDNPAARRAMQNIADEMGISLTPATEALDPDALMMETLLRRSPGTAAAWEKHRVRNILEASGFVERWAESSFGKKISGEAAADRALQAFKIWDDRAKGAQLGMFSDAMKKANSQLRDRPLLEFSNLIDEIDRIEAAGQTKLASSLRRQLSEFSDLQGRPRMTVEQMQNTLSEYGQGVVPGLPSDFTSKHHFAGRVKRALEADLSAAADSLDPALAAAAETLKDARHSYFVMQQPINEAKTNLVRQILDLEKKQNLEFLPKAIISGKYSDRQLTMLRGVMKETDPEAHTQLMRAVWDEVAAKGEEVGKGVLGQRVAQQAELAGEIAFNPSAIADTIRNNRKQLTALSGEGLEKLNTIEKGFRRLATINEELAKSPTATLTISDRLLKVGAGLLFLSPQAIKEAGPELALAVYRKRMTSILTDPKGRDLMAKLLDPPVSATRRTVTTTLQQLQGIIERDEFLFGEEEEPTQ
jgi:hypothetical protein